MTTRTLRRCAMALMVAVCMLAWAGNASAQTVIITMYNDVGSGSSLQAYVQVADESDVGSWGAVHYDYYTYASISGTTGSDSAEGSGLGGWWLEVPHLEGEEGEWDIEAYVTFTCSQGGPLAGAPPAEPVLGTAYRHHYNYHSNNYPFFNYTRDGDSDGRTCSYATVQWTTQSTSGMTISGVFYRIPGVVAICPGICAAGKNGAALGPYGTSGSYGTCN